MIKLKGIPTASTDLLEQWQYKCILKNGSLDINRLCFDILLVGTPTVKFSGNARME